MKSRVRLEIKSTMPGRLLARAQAEGAAFSLVRPGKDGLLIVEADPGSAAVLTALCERFSIPCRELSRSGQDAMLRRLKSRATLLAGLLACVVCMTAFLSRIWLIDVELTGDRGGNPRPIEQALRALDVRPGISARSLDPALLERQLAAAAPDYSFIGVRLQGVRLLVEASCAVPAPGLYALEAAGDLVAACDGVVLSVNVRSGESCVSPGDTVIRGQVLIRGVERSGADTTRPIAALGSVVARTWAEGSASAPLNVPEHVPTGRSSVSAKLRLMGLSWSIREGEVFPSQTCTREILPVGGLFLPLEIVRTTALETEARIVRADEAAVRKSLSALAFADAASKLEQSQPENGRIADRWIEYTKDADGLITARAVYELHKDIAVNRDGPQGGTYIGND